MKDQEGEIRKVSERARRRNQEGKSKNKKEEIRKESERTRRRNQEVK